MLYRQLILENWTRVNEWSASANQRRLTFYWLSTVIRSIGSSLSYTPASQFRVNNDLAEDQQQAGYAFINKG